MRGREKSTENPQVDAVDALSVPGREISRLTLDPRISSLIVRFEGHSRIIDPGLFKGSKKNT